MSNRTGFPLAFKKTLQIQCNMQIIIRVSRVVDANIKFLDIHCYNISLI